MCNQAVNAIFQLFAPIPSWEQQQEVESPLRYSIGFITSSLVSYIVRLRPLNSQCVPFSCPSLSASGRTSGNKTSSGDNVSRTVDDGHTLPRSILRLDLVKFIMAISILMLLTFMTIHLFQVPFQFKAVFTVCGGVEPNTAPQLVCVSVHVCFGVTPIC